MFRKTRRAFLALSLALLTLTGAGCAFAEAGLRELGDDGPNPTYEKKDYWGHFFDSLGADGDC